MRQSTRVSLQRSLLGGALVGFVLCLAAGCLTPDEKVAKSLDNMANAEAEYGTMGISSPVLAAPSSNFAFDLTANADTFFSDAQKLRQGSASELQQSALSAGLGSSATFNPAAGAAYVAQLRQYQQSVANNAAAQSLTDTKNALQNSAAYTQYQADIQQANALTDPIAKADAIATARSKLAAALVGPTPTTLPAFPTPTSQPAAPTNLVSRPTALLQQFAAGGNFAGFMQLTATPPSLAVSDRTALLTAGGDNATKAIFQLLGDPNLISGFNDKTVLFGVCTVSVQPGWRTQRGFAADLSTIVTYKLVHARPAVLERYLRERSVPQDLRDRLRRQSLGLATPPVPLPNLSEDFSVPQDQLETPLYQHGPHVAVISPLTDTQTLDLQSSDRREQDVALSLNIAAQLASIGANAQAQSFLNYAQSLQQDVATVSPDVVVNAYSTGSTFGFQVGPRLRAIAEAQAGKLSGAAEVLDRQSFPALIIFGIERQSFFPQVSWDRHYKRYELYEPILYMQSVNRWVPARRISGYENVWGVGHLGRMFMDRQYFPREEDMLAYLRDLNDNLQCQRKAYVTAHPEDERSNPSNPIIDSQRLRSEVLKTQIFGGRSSVYLPSDALRLQNNAEVTAVQPITLEAGAKATVAVMGHDLEDVDLSRISMVLGDADVGAAALQPPFSATLRDGTLFLQFTPTIFPTLPASSDFGAILAQAKSNLEAATAYAARTGPQVSAVQAEIRSAITVGPSELAVYQAANGLSAAGTPQPLDGTIKAFIAVAAADEKWRSLFNQRWSDEAVKDVERLVTRSTVTTAGEVEARLSGIHDALTHLQTLTNRPATFDPSDDVVKQFTGAVAQFRADLQTALPQVLPAEQFADLAKARAAATQLRLQWRAIRGTAWTPAQAKQFDQLLANAAHTSAGHAEAEASDLGTSLKALKAKVAPGGGGLLDPNTVPEAVAFGAGVDRFADALTDVVDAALPKQPLTDLAKARAAATQLRQQWRAIRGKPWTPADANQFDQLLAAAMQTPAGKAAGEASDLGTSLTALKAKIVPGAGGVLDPVTVAEAAAFNAAVERYADALTTSIDLAMPAQPATDLAKAVARATQLRRRWQAVRGTAWTAPEEQELEDILALARKTNPGNGEAEARELETSLTTLKAKIAPGGVGLLDPSLVSEASVFEAAVDRCADALATAFDAALAERPLGDLAKAVAVATQLQDRWQSAVGNSWTAAQAQQFQTLFAEADRTSAGSAALIANDLRAKLAALKAKVPPGGAATLNPAVLEVAAFGDAIDRVEDNLMKSFEAAVSGQPLTDIGDSTVAAAILSDVWQAIGTRVWTQAEDAQIAYFSSRLKKTPAGAAEATRANLDDALGNLTKSAKHDRRPLDQATAQWQAFDHALKLLASNCQQDLSHSASDAIARLTALKVAEANSKTPTPSLVATLQDRLESLLNTAPSIPSAADRALLTGRAEPTGCAITILEAYKAIQHHQQVTAAQWAGTNDASRLSQSNLDDALRIYDEVQSTVAKGGVTTTPPAAPGRVLANDDPLAANLATAQSNLQAARSDLSQPRTALEQTIVFALPSKSDPRSVIYTPRIRVRSGEPSDLVVAPQTVQLAAPGGGSNTPSTTIGGSTAAADSNATASATGTAAGGTGTKPQTVTVLIAGNNLDRVDLSGIAMVPASKQPLTTRVVGTSIAIDITVSSADSPIYFLLPIAGSNRRVATPPIAVKAAPATPGATTPGTPTVTALYPPGIALLKDSGGKAIPNQSFSILIIGNNLDQVDLAALTVLSGPAKIDPAQPNQPSIAGGIIRVTLQVSDASAPVAIGLPLKSDKTQVIKSVPLIVQ